MSKRTLFVTLTLAVLVIGLPGPAASPGEGWLVLIGKGEVDRLPGSARGAVRGLEELPGAWLAEIDGTTLRMMSRAGAEFEILDRNPRRKTYFLVHTPEPGDATGLAAFGGVSVLDPETCLLRTDGREAREILPPRYEIKSLSFDAAFGTISGDETGQPSGRLSPFLLSPAAFDPSIAGLADQVSEPELSRTILDLQGFGTRYANTANCDAAASYLADAFARLGLEVESDPFTFSALSYPTRNIVATLPGLTRPEYIVVVCAHFDSTSNQAATNAPGADDNASGMAAVLEIARILAGRGFDFTLKFVCFSAEEWGLYGSKHFAQAARVRGDRILAALNLDMIAYADRLPEDLDLVVNGRSLWLYNRYAVCSALYAPMDLLLVANANMRYSDHAPFWDNGFSAILGIEDVGVPNPYYHKTTDTYDTLNMEFAASVTRLTLAVAASLAQPVPGRTALNN